MPNHVSVIIPVLDDTENLAICLNAIQQQVTNYQYEVIVIDNGSSVSPASLVSQYPFAKLFFEMNKGSYYARNCGLKHASGDVVAFTDSDCIPRFDWIENAMTARRTGAGDLIGGKINLLYKNPANPTPAELYESFFAFQQKRNVEKGFAVTANLFVGKNVFAEIGTFYEGTASSGDYEFTTRATKNGFKLTYSEHTVVFHPARHDLQELIEKKKRLINGFYTLRNIVPVMANEFSILKILKHLLPPVLSFKTVYTAKTAMSIRQSDRIKVMLIIYCQKLFIFWYKLTLVSKQSLIKFVVSRFNNKVSLKD